MDGRVRPEPVPDDENIAEWLDEKEEIHEAIVNEMLDAINGVIDQTRSEGEPDIFAYGKLLNYLASTDIKQPELIAICAAALWWLHGEIEGSRVT
jgi:hypothetical protein